MNNPYTSRGPLQDAALFIGRTHELAEIGPFLRGNQSISIVGPRGIGKSSLMLHLMRPESRRTLQIEHDHLLVYIDCQVLSSSRRDEIYAYLCTETAAAIRARNVSTEIALGDAGSKPPRLAFEALLRGVNEHGLRIVFMLDEFEDLALNPHTDVDLLNALRSAAGRFRLAFVTASARPLFDLTRLGCPKPLSSPFFNIFAQLFLGLMPETEARTLIRAPMEAAGVVIDSQLEEFIYQLAGGHPLALQIACYHAWANRDNLRNIQQRTTQELQAHFEDYWHQLSSAERDVLRHMPGARLNEAHDAVIRRILRDLSRKCLLVPAAGSYTYPSEAWAEFVSTRPPDSEATSPIEQPRFSWPEG